MTSTPAKPTAVLTLHSPSSEETPVFDASVLLTKVLRQEHPDVGELSLFRRHEVETGDDDAACAVSSSPPPTPMSYEVPQPKPDPTAQRRSTSTPPPSPPPAPALSAETPVEANRKSAAAPTHQKVGAANSDPNMENDKALEQLRYFESNTRSWYIGDEQRQRANLKDLHEEERDELQQGEVLGNVTYAESMRRSALVFAEAQQWATLKAASKRERRLIEENEEDVMEGTSSGRGGARDESSSSAAPSHQQRDEEEDGEEVSTDEDEESGRAQARRQRRASSTVDLWSDVVAKFFGAEETSRWSLESTEEGNRQRFVELWQMLGERSPTKSNGAGLQHDESGGSAVASSPNAPWPRTLKPKHTLAQQQMKTPENTTHLTTTTAQTSGSSSSRALQLDSSSTKKTVKGSRQVEGGSNEDDDEEEERASLQGRLFPNWVHITEPPRASAIPPPTFGRNDAVSSSAAASQDVEGERRDGRAPMITAGASAGSNDSVAVVLHENPKKQAAAATTKTANTTKQSLGTAVPAWFLDDERAEREDILSAAEHHFNVLQRTMQSYVRVTYDWSAAGYRPQVSTDPSLFRGQQHRPAHLRSPNDTGIWKAMHVASLHPHPPPSSAPSSYAVVVAGTTNPHHATTTASSSRSNSPSTSTSLSKLALAVSAGPLSSTNLRDVERTSKQSPPQAAATSLEHDEGNQHVKQGDEEESPERALQLNDEPERSPQQHAFQYHQATLKRRQVEAALRHAQHHQQQPPSLPEKGAEGEDGPLAPHPPLSIAASKPFTKSAAPPSSSPQNHNNNDDDRTPKKAIFYSPEGTLLIEKEIAARQLLLTQQLTAYSTILARARGGIRTQFDWTASGVVKTVTDRGDKEADKRQRHLPPYMRTYPNIPPPVSQQQQQKQSQQSHFHLTPMRHPHNNAGGGTMMASGSAHAATAVKAPQPPSAELMKDRANSARTGRLIVAL